MAEEGTKVAEEAGTTLTGRCYCGGVQFTVSTAAKPWFAAYCHCDSCRRAHAAPMFQVCAARCRSTAQRGTALTPCVDVQVAWIAADSFKFTAGEDTVKHFQKDKDGNGIVRSFCTNCGTRVRNSMPTKPELCGFFPNLVDVSEDRTAAFAGVWKPQFHWLHTEAVVELAKLEDGIARK